MNLEHAYVGHLATMGQSAPLPHSREIGHGALYYISIQLSPPNHCFVLNIKYIMPQCSDVTSMLHHSAICWWDTAPHAPNVKSLLILITSGFNCFEYNYLLLMYNFCCNDATLNKTIFQKYNPHCLSSIVIFT